MLGAICSRTGIAGVFSNADYLGFDGSLVSSPYAAAHARMTEFNGDMGHRPRQMVSALSPIGRSSRMNRKTDRLILPCIPSSSYTIFRLTDYGGVSSGNPNLEVITTPALLTLTIRAIWMLPWKMLCI